jgi:hypothetical protein
MEKGYGAEIAYIDELKKHSKEDAIKVVPHDSNGHPKLRFSLVKKIKPIPIPGVRTFQSHLHPKLRNGGVGRGGNRHPQRPQRFSPPGRRFANEAEQQQLLHAGYAEDATGLSSDWEHLRRKRYRQWTNRPWVI